MRIIFTNHVLQRSKQRDIDVDDIIETIINPDSVETKSEGVVCYKKVDNKYLLLVYTKDKDGNIVVITAYKTSKLKKYI